MKNDGGKGSKPRPLSITDMEYASRWDAIFGRDLINDDKVAENFNESFVDEKEQKVVYTNS